MFSLLLLNTSKSSAAVGAFFLRRAMLPKSSLALRRTFMAAASQHQLDDDEESVPENLREDRTLSIAKSSPNLKNDMLMNELLFKEHNLSTLDSFYNVNQKEMSLLHHSVLLYKINQTYKEIKKRNAPGHEELPERPGPALEHPSEAQQIASNIFKQVCFHFNRNIKNLDAQSLQTTLINISQGADVDKSELTRESLAEMERKVMQNFPKYMNLDIASIIGSFLKLSHVPREILNEINQMQTLSTFNKYSILIILENLVHLNYDESVELYEKLFKQL